jgi:hypothetical protein
MQVRGDAGRTEQLSQPDHLSAGRADRDVVQADPELGEPVAGRGAGKHRAQDQPRTCVPQPEP